MENKKSNSTTISTKEKSLKEKATKGLMPSSQLMKLFEGELKDIYWAENVVNIQAAEPIGSLKFS